MADWDFVGKPKGLCCRGLAECLAQKMGLFLFPDLRSMRGIENKQSKRQKRTIVSFRIDSRGRH